MLFPKNWKNFVKNLRKCPRPIEKNFGNLKNQDKTYKTFKKIGKIFQKIVDKFDCIFLIFEKNFLKFEFFIQRTPISVV